MGKMVWKTTLSIYFPFQMAYFSGAFALRLRECISRIKRRGQTCWGNN